MDLYRGDVADNPDDALKLVQSAIASSPQLDFLKAIKLFITFGLDFDKTL